MLEGIAVSLIDMMNCRERRANIQTDFVQKFNCPVISFCLNIPGPIKTNPQIQELFSLGKESIIEFLSLKSISINKQLEFHDITGDELLISVNENANILKTAMTHIEESHPLGRLFDIDIIDINNKKISRPSYRKCLICNKQAQECARSRAHSIEEMQNKINELLQNLKD